MISSAKTVKIVDGQTNLLRNNIQVTASGVWDKKFLELYHQVRYTHISTYKYSEEVWIYCVFLQTNLCAGRKALWSVVIHIQNLNVDLCCSSVWCS